MKDSKSLKERKSYEKPELVFKSALEAYAQTCTGDPKNKSPNSVDPICETGFLFS